MASQVLAKKSLYCLDADNSTQKMHPIIDQLMWQQRLLSMGSNDFPSIFNLVADTSSNEDKELVTLSRKLCKRYFGKAKGQLNMEDVFPRSIEVLKKS